jgi:flavin-dependent dehydrogenase
VLCEKRRFPRPHIGESLTPQILPVLDFLGIRAQVEAAGFLRMVGHTVCWGDASPRTSYYSPDLSRRGFQVWREDFDSLLLAHARDGGVQVFEEQTLKSVQVHDAGVTVATEQGQMTATFFVDATGHAGILAKQELRQRDPVFQTLAITGYWRNASGPPEPDFANTLLETYENGLVWSVPLHNGLRNVTLLVDWRIGRRIRQPGLRSFYQAELARTSYILQFLQQAQLVIPPRAFDATWHSASAFAGTRFLLAGDAGMFVDPLSSEGVHKAMASAITGAAVVNTILRRPSMTAPAIQFYDESQRTTYDMHYHQSVRYYQEERRWLDSPFWRLRSEDGLEGKRQKAKGENSEWSGVRKQAPVGHRQVTVSKLGIAPGVTIEPRPVIEGPFVALREVVITSRYPRGVRFLDSVCIPVLLQAVQAHASVAKVMEAYLNTPEGRACPPEAVRQVLARLYQEGVLTTTAPDETRSN